MHKKPSLTAIERCDLFNRIGGILAVNVVVADLRPPPEKTTQLADRRSKTATQEIISETRAPLTSQKMVATLRKAANFNGNGTAVAAALAEDASSPPSTTGSASASVSASASAPVVIDYVGDAARAAQARTR